MHELSCLGDHLEIGFHLMLWWRVTAPLLLSDDGGRQAYDMYVIGTQESGGTIRRGLLPGRGEQCC